MAEQAILALGSNLNNPSQQVLQCVKALDTIQGIKVLDCSSLYSSSPRGPQDQDDFVNAVVLIETELPPVDLLQATQALEQNLGRVKTRHWGERTIDIDIAFYGKQEIQLEQPELTIPHREALVRDFVVIPTLEIAEDWQLPDGTLLRAASSKCLRHDLHKIDVNLACPERNI